MTKFQAILLFVVLAAAWGIVFIFGISPAKKKQAESERWQESGRPVRLANGEIAPFDPAFQWLSPLELASLPEVSRVEFPMGTENGALIYDAQPFWEKNESFSGKHHLGNDLNGIGGENTDKGDPVFAMADGRVVYAATPSPGWGGMVILAHALPAENPGSPREVIQSVYAHLDTLLVAVGLPVKRGQKIGTVGDAGGRYFAHLHLELRKTDTVYPSVGYHPSSPLNRLHAFDWLKSQRSKISPKSLYSAPVQPAESIEISRPPKSTP